VDFLPYIIAGLVTGSVYGLAGTGLVLTYKTSGVFNFAHGALATVSAFLFYSLHVTHGLAWPWAALVCLLVAGPVLGLVFELIARALAGASLATRVACTIGVLLIVSAVIVIIYGTNNDKTLPHFLPQNSFTVDGTPVSAEQIIIFAVALLATVGLYLFFRQARLGVAMRAVVDNPDLLDVAGTSPRVVRRWAWIIGVTFASASGLLIGPLITPLNPITLTFLVVTAFGAAAIGAFTSLPMTYVGGLVIGLGQAFCSKYFDTGFWTGLAPSLPFVVLFAVLLLSPRRRLAERSLIIPRGRSTWTTPLPLQAAGGVAILGLFLFVPSFAGIHLTDWTNSLAMLILFLSLGLLVRTSGQVSLCHVSFLAIGACAMSRLTVAHGVPWVPALLISGLIAVPIGALLAIPAIRLSGLYLALATFGFGLLLQYMFYSEDYMFGAFGAGRNVPRPHLSWLTLDSDKGFYYLVLALAVLSTLGVVAINRSRLGRLLRGLADSPTGLATSGTATNVTRVLVFCISAFLAAIAGALQGASQGNVSGDAYQPINSLIYFALIIISIGGEPWYALMAALGLTLVPSYITGNDTTNYLQLLFGAGAVLYAVTPDHLRGAPPALQRVLDRLGRRRHAPAVAVLAEVPAQREPEATQGQLEVKGLRVQFGGLVAVDGVSLAAPTGRITGLIGPNGAGKTTTFNACSGLNRPSAGRISIDDHDVSHAGAATRARRGLGRTFQQMELFDSLTVRQNVALGIEGSFAGPNPLSHLLGTPPQKRRVREATDRALRLCDLAPIAATVVGSLSTGQRRLVELARCLAGPFHLLLLDEPSSGLDRVETERFGAILQRVVRERGVGILLVEHDMSLVTQVCDYIYVLDFGKPIFEGGPAEVMGSPLVQAAYLGGDDVEKALALPPAEEASV
jgi:ABC-type branched-subunit amino acid transport system ATPase component/branched-subunit amino acid ABC-type transport system permease component